MRPLNANRAKLPIHRGGERDRPDALQSRRNHQNARPRNRQIDSQLLNHNGLILSVYNIVARRFAWDQPLTVRGSTVVAPLDTGPFVAARNASASAVVRSRCPSADCDAR